MTSAWFLGARNAVPQTEDEVRSTVEPVRTDQVPELDSPPEWNEFDSDESGALVGLSPRQVSSDVHESIQYVPWWEQLATENHNRLIDDQVATSGTAAKRESAGEQGHGTMEYSVGIEPQVRDGAAYGNEYFVTHSKLIQDGSGNYMTPPDTDNWLQGVASARAEQASREAFQATQYDAFLKG